ncbi:MAG: SDR family oxidoreductase [Eubacteriales bacterium]|nr:SDR family oxidoreductase [Eubacteriales bacterium]
MKQLNEKVAIVTGAGQGIGKGIARCLAQRGVKVVCIGRRAEPIEATVQEIREMGGEAFSMTCDVADRARVAEVVKKTVETYGTVDIMVNNAQSLPGSKPVEETTYEDMHFAWMSGTIGSLNFMQECFPYMKEQGEGRIINFASATGMFGYENHLAYGANKESVRGVTKIAGKEWAKYGITVNCILPGSESPAQKVWATKHPDMYQRILAQQPMRRFGQAEEDIAPVVAFLAGPDSAFYTAQCLLVDGGYSVAP